VRRTPSVNDTQEILELVRDLLEIEGYDVVLFSYAPHEIVEIERVQPDLIIVDIVFGNAVLGWQLLDKLKMHRPTAHIPVVVCSAAVRDVREMEGRLKSMG
jgi:CheY-like chemotaxis protein